jgi:hypothetical protein
MDCPYRVTIHDRKLAEQTKNFVKIGHYFVFAEERNPQGHNQKISGRLARLLIQKADKVFPLADMPVALEGLTITPVPKPVSLMGCIVSDRDIYRAGQDNIRLFVACLPPCRTLNLTVEMQGVFFAARKVELTDGAGMETFSGLLPGEYSARIDMRGRPLGQSVFFTVAEDKAAPMRVRLLSHRFNKAAGNLFFALSAESYRMPFGGQIIAAVTEKDKTLAETILQPISPGYYEGKIGIKGQGPFRLRLTAADDPERVTDIAVPWTRKTDRDVSVINELGTDVQFSMMPEPDALPIRGGWLTRGDFLPTPLIVEEVVTDTPVIHAAVAVESLVLVNLDLATGRYSVQEAGDMKSGSRIRAEVSGAMSMVFVGCFVSGRPFEGYTTFISPVRLRVSAEVPAIIGPGKNLSVKLRCEGTDRPVPVLICVRDERLSADTPGTALGTSLKRCMDNATRGMAEAEIMPLNLPDETREPLTEEKKDEVSDPEDDPLVLSGIETEYEDIIDLSDDLVLSLSDIAEDSEKISEVIPLDESDPEPEFRTMEFNADQMYTALDGIVGEKQKTESLIPDDKSLPDQVDTAKKDRADKHIDGVFPEILFYGIISVAGTAEVIIPSGNSRGIFAVETFALTGTDWASHRTIVTAGPRVRAELDLPPAVHPDDHVVGRVRISSASGKASVCLMRDEVPVKFRAADKSDTIADVMDTPVELEFDVVPGRYTATASDPILGESDTTEEQVGEPGRFGFYAKELLLLQKGESLSLHSDSRIRLLRVLPNLDDTYKQLATAIIRYPHHGCVQTAAKILAATFMYVSAQTQGGKAEAEQIILAEVAQVQKMLIPDRGFVLYPGENFVHEYYSPLTVRYLRTLSKLSAVSSLSPGLRQAVAEGLSLAERAAKAHGMKRIPDRIASPEDVYAAASAGKDKGEIVKFIEEFIVFSDSSASPAQKQHAAADRASLAYCAAALIATGDLRQGIAIANQVFSQFNAQGSLYSSVDSVAALVLMTQLGLSGIIGSSTHILVNGRKMTVSEAVQTEEALLSLEVQSGIAAVEITRIREEDWSDHDRGFPVKAEFRNTGGKKIRYFKAGDRADLLVSLPDGYETGDVVLVSLPACMSPIRGDGKTRRFSVAFEGRNEVRIPVVVCSEIRGRQHFALCVRNIFEEERIANPGILSLADNFISDKYSGKWRIIESDYTDLPAPGYVTLNPNKASGFKIGRLQGIMDCRIEQYGDSERIEFSWYGKIGTVIAYGRGWARIRDEKLCGRIYIHDGDDSEFVAVRV